MHKTINKKAAKSLFLYIKYFPIIIAFLYLIHIIIGLLGYKDFILNNLIVGSIPNFIVMFTASIVFRFCWIHKAFILYDIHSSLCDIYNSEIGFTSTITFHRITGALYGIVLFTVLYFNFKKFCNCASYKKIIRLLT